MDNIRRQQIAVQGHKLAAWLNDPKWEKNRVRLNIALDVLLNDCERDLLTAAEHVDRAVNSKWVDVRMRGRFVPRGQGMAFELEPYDEESRWLYVWGVLHNTGCAARLRSCPNCGKFWYCEGRTDRRTCSKACKDALWEKTPEGREKKAAYMRRKRAKDKEDWEKMTKGRTRKRGRNLHVSLKKGE